MTQTPSSLRVPIWIWLLALLAVLASVTGLWRAMADRQANAQALAKSIQDRTRSLHIPASEWMQASVQPIALGIPITGTLEALDHAVVKARTPGELQGLQVREGDSVQRGQVLAKVDATEMEARFRQAKLQADAAQAQVTIAQRQHNNNRALLDKGFISETALTASLSQLQAAQANHAAARAAQDAARKSLDDTVLRSPIDGHIARRMAHSGERVNVEAPVVEVVNLSQLELQAQVPANDSALLQPGQAATLQLRSSHGQPAQPLPAQLVRINPSATSSNRAVPVYLRVQPSTDITLRPGMYVEGIIHTGQLNTLAIPLSAVHTDQPLPYVQTVQDGLVQHTTVILGPRSASPDEVLVAVEGLHAGQVLLKGQVGRLPAGTHVQLQAQTAASSAPAPTRLHP